LTDGFRTGIYNCKFTSTNKIGIYLESTFGIYLINNRFYNCSFGVVNSKARVPSTTFYEASKALYNTFAGCETAVFYKVRIGTSLHFYYNIFSYNDLCIQVNYTWEPDDTYYNYNMGYLKYNRFIGNQMIYERNSESAYNKAFCYFYYNYYDDLISNDSDSDGIADDAYSLGEYEDTSPLIDLYNVTGITYPADTIDFNTENKNYDILFADKVSHFGYMSVWVNGSPIVAGFPVSSNGGLSMEYGCISQTWKIYSAGRASGAVDIYICFCNADESFYIPPGEYNITVMYSDGFHENTTASTYFIIIKDKPAVPISDPPEYRVYSYLDDIEFEYEFLDDDVDPLLYGKFNLSMVFAFSTRKIYRPGLFGVSDWYYQDGLDANSVFNYTIDYGRLMWPGYQFNASDPLVYHFSNSYLRLFATMDYNRSHSWAWRPFIAYAEVIVSVYESGGYSYISHSFAVVSADYSFPTMEEAIGMVTGGVLAAGMAVLGLRFAAIKLRKKKSGDVIF